MEFNVNDGPFTGMSGAATATEFPSILGYDDVARDMWTGPEDSFLLGVNGKGETEGFSVTSDSPHMFVSAPSNTGKSVIAANVATQTLVRGGSAVFLDVKRISHRWAKNLPGVTYAVEVDEIANVIVSVAAEMRRRMRVIENFPGSVKDAMANEPRIVIIAEEINSMMGELEEFERGLPVRGCYKPRRAFKDIMNQGRAAKINIVAFAQYPDTRLIPRPMIEGFGTRILIRHTNESWKSLAYNLGYSPPAPQAMGRGLMIRGGKAIETQFLYLSEEQCAELVRQLRPEAERVGMIREVKRALAQRRELRAASQ